jgi:hypothetical protein
MTVSKKYNDNLVAGGAVRDGNGNRIDTTYADVDLSNLSTTGNAKIKDVFVAEYGVTTYQEVLDAYNTGKLILCTYSDDVIQYKSTYIMTLSDVPHTTLDDTPFFEFRSGLCTIWYDGVVGANKTRFIGTRLSNSNGWGNVTTYIVEQTSNKVTSISSSSTDEEYPSAKCVYDLTENNRFDGQWVSSDLVLSTATAINIYTLDLETYLPDTTGNYEVMVAYTIGAKSTSVSNTKIYSDIMPISPSYMRQKTSSTTHTIFNSCLISIPVQRYLYFQISNQATDSTNIEVVGYRRLGTNS